MSGGSFFLSFSKFSVDKSMLCFHSISSLLYVIGIGREVHSAVCNFLWWLHNSICKRMASDACHAIKYPTCCHFGCSDVLNGIKIIKPRSKGIR